MKMFLIVTICLLLFSCGNEEVQATGYEILNTYSHDRSYFTQGFEFLGDTLIEGTGLYGSSRLIKYDIGTGTVYNKISLSSEYFGEGVTVLDGKIYQLTWYAGKCFVYDFDDLSKIGEFSYFGQGWGLCNDGESLIMSNGSSTILFRDPVDFTVKRSISVRDSKGDLINKLNELEYAEGYIYANIYQSDKVISVDPVTGSVVSVYDMSGLRKKALETNSGSDVLNGIAYKDGSFYLTGKLWPYIFEVALK